jgi:hypothetical protein
MIKKLLVEGTDDKHIILALRDKYDIPLEYKDIIDCNGIEKLISLIPSEIKTPDIDSLGIIVDADTDLQARYDSIKNKLLNFNFPKKMPEKGLILDNGEQRIGVWIMPNNNLNGILEDFISFLVPADDKLLPIVDETLQSIENQKLNQYAYIHKSKARIHTWLAWQENPGTPMGQSITKKYLSTDKATCLNFIQWLTELFR